jgi:hypothetical protein
VKFCRAKDIIDDYYQGIDLKAKLDHDPSTIFRFDFTHACVRSGLGRFYSSKTLTQENDIDSDRHYAELLHIYGDAAVTGTPQPSAPIESTCEVRMFIERSVNTNRSLAL